MEVAVVKLFQVRKTKGFVTCEFGVCWIFPVVNEAESTAAGL